MQKWRNFLIDKKVRLLSDDNENALLVAVRRSDAGELQPLYSLILIITETCTSMGAPPFQLSVRRINHDPVAPAHISCQDQLRGQCLHVFLKVPL